MWPDDYGLPNHFPCFWQLVFFFFFFPLESEAMRLPTSDSPSISQTFWYWMCSIVVLPSHKYFFLCSYQLGLWVEEVASGSGRSMFNVLYIHFMPLSDSIFSYHNSKWRAASKRSVLLWKPQTALFAAPVQV